MRWDEISFWCFISYVGGGLVFYSYQAENGNRMENKGREKDKGQERKEKERGRCKGRKEADKEGNACDGEEDVP